ncbi:RagB/SusD family nutrient uptake outer membrane protein [Chitinophaga defluvii]|uniref:RagB/SusD family nutrient uptake outer membrane protein n=1 Tax=Chitinophaga defluvii TaxID=3163343 RepID=A0ABV2T1E4_9BACT
MKQSIIHLILPVILVLSACNKDYLTRNNPTSTTDESWWRTQAQLDGALDYIYASVPQGGYAGNPNGRIFFSTMTDDAYWNGNFYGSLNTVALGDGNPSLGWPYSGVWENNYARIRMASRFIENAERAYMDSTLRTRYIYEARAMRAWYHLDLYLYFGAIPIITKAVTPVESGGLKRSSIQEVVNFITSELEICAAKLPVSYNNDQAKRITKGACLSMRAIAFLNARMYSEAATAARQVIDLKDENGAAVYRLHNSGAPDRNSYADLFSYNGKINRERIFMRTNGLNDIWFRNAPSGVPPGPAQAATNPTEALANSYETLQGKTLAELGNDSMDIYKKEPNYKNNRDPRLQYTLLYPNEVFEGRKLEPFNADPNNSDRIGGPTGSATGFWMRKYLDPQDKGATESSTLDFMIIRYAEILLTYIEAKVESNDWQDPAVIQYLNDIRNRAGMPNVNVAVYNTQEKLRQLYQRERRVELALEGARLFDIRRWKIGALVMRGSVEGATNPATGKAVVVQTRKFNEQRDYLWPIPQNEIKTSQIIQNEGY